jgi:hypothetical protein
MIFASDFIRNYGGKNLIKEEHIFSEMCQGCSPSKAKFKKTDFVDNMVPTVNLNQPRKSDNYKYIGILENITT